MMFIRIIGNRRHNKIFRLTKPPPFLLISLLIKYLESSIRTQDNKKLFYYTFMVNLVKHIFIHFLLIFIDFIIPETRRAG